MWSGLMLTLNFKICLSSPKFFYINWLKIDKKPYLRNYDTYKFGVYCQHIENIIWTWHLTSNLSPANSLRELLLSGSFPSVNSWWLSGKILTDQQFLKSQISHSSTNNCTTSKWFKLPFFPILIVWTSTDYVYLSK